jgi:hypothetical protein
MAYSMSGSSEQASKSRTKTSASSFHPKLESQTSSVWNPVSQQALIGTWISRAVPTLQS